MKQVNISDYNALNKKDFYNKVALYIIVILIFVFISIIILLKIKKTVYYRNRIFVSKDSIVTNILVDDLENINNHQYMFIGNDLVKYEVKNVELINDSISYYRISLSLENNYYKGNIMDYKIQLDKENMLDYLISFIGG